MPGGVDHPQRVFLPVENPWYADSLGFDSDAPLLFDIHTVEEPVMHLTLPNDTGQLEYPVSYGRLPVIDMRNNSEIPDKRLPGKTGLVLFCHYCSS